MSVLDATDVVGTMEKAKGELRAVEHTTDSEIDAVSRTFQSLAGDTDIILDLAAAIVACVEAEEIRSVLPQVRTLGGAAKEFIAARLQATPGILQTVAREVELLRQLSQITHSQKSIALQTGALQVLTNMEAARLGSVGTGFHYLARELAEFSRSVTEDTQKLENHTDDRRAAIEETGRVLSAELPRLRDKFAHLEVDLDKALVAAEASLTQLSTTPQQFRISVQEIAGQIAGAVAAIQAHDITRQQIEHVQEGFSLISGRMRGDAVGDDGAAQNLPQAYAGLTIQIYQLRAIRETVSTWASQIRTCMQGILRISASEVAGIGPLVLEQEKNVSCHLANIERLEEESQTYSERVQHTLGGLSNLTQLFGEHLQKSKAVRDRFQMLSFNSIIEASHLGKKADAMLAIARSINGVSDEWKAITDRSGVALEEIVKLAQGTNGLMEAFSGASNEKLRQAQTQTRASLDALRTAAAFAVDQSHVMKIATDKMQAKIAKVGKTGDLLDSCFGGFDVVLTKIESVKHQLESDDPDLKKRYDPIRVEQLFSASYTTEMEREVLHAALRGAVAPVAKQTFAGNSVELF